MGQYGNVHAYVWVQGTLSSVHYFLITVTFSLESLCLLLLQLVSHVRLCVCVFMLARKRGRERERNLLCNECSADVWENGKENISDIIASNHNMAEYRYRFISSYSEIQVALPSRIIWWASVTRVSTSDYSRKKNLQVKQFFFCFFLSCECMRVCLCLCVRAWKEHTWQRPIENAALCFISSGFLHFNDYTNCLLSITDQITKARRRI